MGRRPKRVNTLVAPAIPALRLAGRHRPSRRACDVVVQWLCDYLDTQGEVTR